MARLLLDVFFFIFVTAVVSVKTKTITTDLEKSVSGLQERLQNLQSSKNAYEGQRSLLVQQLSGVQDRDLSPSKLSDEERITEDEDITRFKAILQKRSHSKRFWKAFGDWFKKTGSGIANFFKNVVDELKLFYDGMFDKEARQLSSIYDSLISIGNTVTSQTKNQLVSLYNQTGVLVEKLTAEAQKQTGNAKKNAARLQQIAIDQREEAQKKLENAEKLICLNYQKKCFSDADCTTGGCPELKCVKTIASNKSCIFN